MATLIHWLEAGRRLAERIPYGLVALFVRFAVASVFWRSGLTKVETFQLKDTASFRLVEEQARLVHAAGEFTLPVFPFQIKDKTFFLFAEEYKVPLLPPDVATYITSIAEPVLSACLIVGLASRLSALGLMIMTLVIQIFVYPSGWPDHILWLALLLVIIARGPGAISLDRLIWPRVQPEPEPAP